MSTENSKHDHILTVYVFLGSATFTALFFLLQYKDPIKFHDELVAGLASISILFIVLTVARLNISNGLIGSNTIFARAVGWSGVAGFTGLLSILVVIVIGVNSTMGIIVLAFTIAFVLFLHILSRRS